jgi:hypothetical protein
MTATAQMIPILRVRHLFGRSLWRPPREFGASGWSMLDRPGLRSIIISADVHRDTGLTYIHASITGKDAVPSYADLALLHKGVWGDDGYAYQVFAPASEHVNIHPHALHLWGAADGHPILPEFGITILDGIKSI